MELEITEYNGGGYKPLVKFDNWRVAVIKYAPRLDMNNISRVERHSLTDEVFILTQGEATLYIGKQMIPHEMINGKIYNVKKGAWHHITVSKDANVIVVENDNTSAENTEYFYIKEANNDIN